MRIPCAAAIVAAVLSPLAGLAQTQPGATPQNSQDLADKTAKDPAFAGAEQPRPADPAATATPSPREGMNVTPTKTPDESTQQAK